MARELSAKDRAFLREKAKLQVQIRNAQQAACEWAQKYQDAQGTIHELQEENARLVDMIKELSDRLDIPRDELLAHIKRTKDVDSVLKFITGVYLS